MPYLTLWDKISQKLAHLEGNSHKKFKSHRIFRPFYNRFYEEINLIYTLLWLSQASYMKEKHFRLYWRSFKVMFKEISQNFVKSPFKVCLISQILVHSLWHICIQWLIMQQIMSQAWKKAIYALTLCMLGNFACSFFFFCCLWIFFLN